MSVTPPIVRIASGAIAGLRAEGVRAFRGISLQEMLEGARMILEIGICLAQRKIELQALCRR